MKRILILSVCMMLVGALTAQADIINVTRTSDSVVIGHLSYTRTTSGTTLDKVVFSTLDWIPTSGNLVGLNGTWSAVEPSKYLQVATAAYGWNPDLNDGEGGYEVSGSWATTTTKGHSGILTTEAKTSFMGPYGFGSQVPGTQDPATGLCYEGGELSFGRSGTWSEADQKWSGMASTYLRGTWYDTTAVTTGSIFATMYISKNANISYLGQMGLVDGSPVVSFSTLVPEPGTIVMLASGLMGLLCYAWRKRK